MDTEKIGKFIAKTRKNKNLTQEALANKLSISDRAVSKWERGINLPDASLMLELCNILGITVNELLTGEKLDKEKYVKKAEENLIDLKTKEEKINKKFLRYEYVTGFSGSIAFILLIFIASYLEMTNLARVILIVLAIILFIIGAFSSLKIEREVGFYECPKCNHRYVPEKLPFYFSMHINRTRYLKCPKCKQRSFQKKVLSK